MLTSELGLRELKNEKSAQLLRVMRTINPEYNHRFSIEAIKQSYDSLDAAFENGDYSLVAEFAENGSELLGEALILRDLSTKVSRSLMQDLR